MYICTDIIVSFRMLTYTRSLGPRAEDREGLKHENVDGIIKYYLIYFLKSFKGRETTPSGEKY